MLHWLGPPVYYWIKTAIVGLLISFPILKRKFLTLTNKYDIGTSLVVQ